VKRAACLCHHPARMRAYRRAWMRRKRASDRGYYHRELIQHRAYRLARWNPRRGAKRVLRRQLRGLKCVWCRRPATTRAIERGNAPYCGEC
jgi:hypothetical protein